MKRMMINIAKLSDHHVHVSMVEGQNVPQLKAIRNTVGINRMSRAIHSY